ncbi:MAG TPA: class I SAM-dependent methyltransferase, partial [Tepidisphaeraceae bacterium]|nr:class I SAM-dependent methyltransferase [Tepidisphaeraceae bacterium]
MPNFRPLMRRARSSVDVVRHLVGWHQSEAALVRDAQRFWEAPPPKVRDAYSHWRGGFDDATWLAIGRQSFDIFESFARSTNFQNPVKRVVEWGCGGGANAVHFGRITEEFYGVDIAQSSLDECARQMTAEGLNNFKPVLIHAADPRTALKIIPAPCDLFVSFYVFELLPTPQYGVQVL